jgi:FMN phosphatase YigB (HAD superfamily)
MNYENKRNTLVLFDVGAVLVKLDYKSFFDKAAEIRGCAREEFVQMYNASNIEIDSILGKMDAQENLEKVGKLVSPSCHLSNEQTGVLLKLNWPGEIREVVDLKHKVFKAGYSVGILSNIGEFAFDAIGGQWPDIFDLYDPSMPAVYSYRVGSMKPQQKIYEQVKGYGKVILIDDKESYLRTGIEHFGWIGIHFTPYIDHAEAIRAQHNDTTKPANDFYVADSQKELEGCLRKLGLKI